MASQFTHIIIATHAGVMYLHAVAIDSGSLVNGKNDFLINYKNYAKIMLDFKPDVMLKDDFCQNYAKSIILC